MPWRRIGSIASSGKPPLPQIARTPYCEPSGSVNRTIRALVVVPMQTGSYLLVEIAEFDTDRPVIADGTASEARGSLGSASQAPPCSPTFLTPGAVWSRNEPRRSIGGPN